MNVCKGVVQRREESDGQGTSFFFLCEAGWQRVSLTIAQWLLIVTATWPRDMLRSIICYMCLRGRGGGGGCFPG